MARSRRRSQKSSGFTKLSFEALEPRRLLATIDLFAAGVLGEEQVSLQIDGQTVKTWTNLGGDAYQGQFETLTFTTPNPVSADQVRVTFDNDLYDPILEIDRNVRINAIAIDGIRYETEDPLVYSTGTWKPEDGITPGFRQSEYLHTDGYFQFASTEANTGTRIEVRAFGDEGVELFELQIDNLTVASFSASTSFQTFRYVSPNTVTADQVRVRFINDVYDPGNNIDRNLTVDYLALDGLIYETESPRVYSTGTWLSVDGITPGFRESQMLHANGYFAWEQAVNPGAIRLRSSVINVAETDPQARIVVERISGSDGAISVDYRTVANSATPGQDYADTFGTITFLDGETTKIIIVPLIDDVTPEANEQFGFTIDNISGNATLLAPRTATITIDDNDSVQADGDGLLGEYFNSPDLTDRFSYRIDATVNFDWQKSAPIPGMNADRFSVRWTGQIEPRFSETYTFQTTSDDGIRLWVNDQLIVDYWNDQSSAVHTGSIALIGGELYSIRLEHFENTGDAVAQLAWSSISQPLEVIPESQLYAADPPPVTPGDQLETQVVASGLIQPTAMDFSPDGSQMFIAEQRGVIRLVENGTLLATPFLDFTDRINGTRDRGLLDIAIHPDFENQPYVYLFYTYDPPEVYNQAVGSLAGPDGKGNRTGRLTRVTANAANNYRSIIPGSEVVLVGKNGTWNNFNAFANSTNDFNEPAAGILSDGSNLQDFIATDSESHTVGAIEFGVDGMLYATIGDGASYNQVDPRAVRVQDIDNLSGKLLRIDPITGQGPADNPFFDGNPTSNRSRVFQLGLRNGFRMAVNQESGQVVVGDVGWTQWEEINAAAPGANFGWPYFEGGNGTSNRTLGYQNLPDAQSFYASGTPVTPSIYALNHGASGINAIVLGDFSQGTTYPAQYRGDLFFNDLGQGIVRNISFDSAGNITDIGTFTSGAEVVVQIVEGPDGNLYFVDLDDGIVGRWVFVATQNSVTIAARELPGAPVAERNPAISGSGANVVVAVIDSGIDLNLAQLQTSRWTNPGEIPGDGIDNDNNAFIDDVWGYDFVDQDGTPIDTNGHGTMIAGLIAGKDNGLAPEAQIMHLRAVDELGVGSPQATARAIRYAVNQGARIINLSLELETSDELEQAIAFAQQQNVIVVVAAGSQRQTSGTSLASLSARFDNVVSAGAFDADGRLLMDTRQVGLSGTVQLDARGVAFGQLPGNQWTTFQGTSVAAATISGTLARLLSVNPQLTASQLRQILIHTARQPASGSDSAGSIDMVAAEALATNSLLISVNRVASAVYVDGSPQDDQVQYQVHSDRILINGINYPINPMTTKVVFRGHAGFDQLEIGDSAGNDYATIMEGMAQIVAKSQSITGRDFESVTFRAGSGNDSIWSRGTKDDDVATMDPNRFQMDGLGYHWTGEGFDSVRVVGAGGLDRAQLNGSNANERFFGTPGFSRVVGAAWYGQAIGFPQVEVAMGDGFDTAILIGSPNVDSLAIASTTVTLVNPQVNLRIDDIQRTTSYGGASMDQLTLLDGPEREVVNSRPGNSLVVSDEFEHRIYGYHKSHFQFSGGEDRITLYGSGAGDRLTGSPSLFQFSGSDHETTWSGAVAALVISNGGSGAAWIAGSGSDDEFYFSPALSVVSGLNFELAMRRFSDLQFTGNGGYDRVRLVDGEPDDRLLVENQRVSLFSDNYQVRVSDIDDVIARSLVDDGLDVIDYLDVDLDFSFQTLGDWA